jgi:hypothetical protein
LNDLAFETLPSSVNNATSSTASAPHIPETHKSTENKSTSSSASNVNVTTLIH